MRKNVMITMRQFWLIVCCLLGSVEMSAAQNLLTLPFVRVTNDANGTFGIDLTNQQIVSRGQFRLTYNAQSGFEIQQITPTARLDGSEVSVARQARASGEIELLVTWHTAQNAPIRAGSGELFTVEYQTAPTAAGLTSLMLTDVLLTDNSNNALPVSYEHGTVLMQYHAAPISDDVDLPTAADAPVPEPATFGVVGLGCVLLLIMRRRR